MSKSSRTSPWLSRSAIARFRPHVVVTEACEIWLGAVGSDGYGWFSVRSARVERIVNPHLVAATLAFGPVPDRVDADARPRRPAMRVCRAGHVRVATQGENTRQAARRGRAAGPRPRLVDVRGNVGAARAIQEALRDQASASPAELAQLLARALADGDPLPGVEGLFDLRDRATVLPSTDFPQDLLELAARRCRRRRSRPSSRCHCSTSDPAGSCAGKGWPEPTRVGSGGPRPRARLFLDLGRFQPRCHVSSDMRHA